MPYGLAARCAQPGLTPRFCFEQSEFFSILAKELTEGLARVRAGKALAAFPAAHGLGIGANFCRQLFLRQVT